MDELPRPYLPWHSAEEARTVRDSRARLPMLDTGAKTDADTDTEPERGE